MSKKEQSLTIQRENSLVQQAQVRLGPNNNYSTCASATLPNQDGTQQPNQRQKNREKVLKMKEIKKYFDSFLKEIKDLNKEIAVTLE